MYIEYARKMRPGESTAPDGDPPSSAAVAGEPDAPATRCPPTSDAVSWANRQTSQGHDRSADRTERHRRGVREQGEDGRADRLETKARENRRGDRHRGAETRDPLE